MTTRNLLLLAAVALAPACWLEPTSGVPVLDGEDVRMDVPGDAFRGAGDRGAAYDLARETAADTNGWVAETVQGMGELVHELDGYPEDRREGSWRVWGPHSDDAGRDASWLVRIDGDESRSSVEVYIGHADADDAGDMDLVLWGDVDVEGSTRKGGFAIDFDAYMRHPEVHDRAYESEVATGTIHVDFSRDTKSRSKTVNVEFDGVKVTEDGETYDFDDETYSFRRDATGAGTFHLAVRSPFEEEGWSGPEVERMELDMAWDKQQAGRARGRILESKNQGDLRHGDIELSECFDGSGGLTWRFLTEAYAVYEPSGYNFGNEKSCVVPTSALDGR